MFENCAVTACWLKLSIWTLSSVIGPAGWVALKPSSVTTGWFSAMHVT